MAKVKIIIDQENEIVKKTPYLSGVEFLETTKELADEIVRKGLAYYPDEKPKKAAAKKATTSKKAKK